MYITTTHNIQHYYKYIYLAKIFVFVSKIKLPIMITMAYLNVMHINAFADEENCFVRQTLITVHTVSTDLNFSRPLFRIIQYHTSYFCDLL